MTSTFTVSKKTLKIAAVALVAFVVLVGAWLSLPALTAVLPSGNGDSPSTTPPDGQPPEDGSNGSAEQSSLTFIEITVSPCADCISLGTLTDTLSAQAQGTEIQTRSFAHDSQEAQALIAQYGLRRVPTLLVQGDTSVLGSDFAPQWEALGTQEEDGTLVVRNQPPIYFDLEEARFVGRVEMIRLMDASCAVCRDPPTEEDFLAFPQPIFISESRDVDINSAEGRALIEKYNIPIAPTLILSPDIQAYTDILTGLSEVTEVQDDGWMVFTQATPPYKDLSTGELKGALTATFLVDENCTACPNEQALEAFLKREDTLALYITDTNTLSSSSEPGRELADAFELTRVPAVHISGDLDAYPLLPQIWSFFGVNDENAYVFTELELLLQFDESGALSSATYVDLESGEEIALGAVPS